MHFGLLYFLLYLIQTIYTFVCCLPFHILIRYLGAVYAMHSCTPGVQTLRCILASFISVENVNMLEFRTYIFWNYGFHHKFRDVFKLTNWAMESSEQIVQKKQWNNSLSFSLPRLEVSFSECNSPERNYEAERAFNWISDKTGHLWYYSGISNKVLHSQKLIYVICI